MTEHVPPDPPEPPAYPIPLAMIVCDGVYVDSASGKKTLLGMFSTIGGVAFPLTLPSLCLYVAMTNGHGKTPFSVRLVDVDEERPPVLDVNGTWDFADPRIVLEVVNLFGNLVFPEPDEYRFQLLAGTTLLLERRILVHSLAGDTDGVEPT